MKSERLPDFETEWSNANDAPLPQELPVPSRWCILVMPILPKTISKGGIHIPIEVQDAEDHLQIVGRIAALGPLAFKARRFATGPWDYLRILCGLRVSWAPQVGDWVIFGRYTGQRIEYRHTKLILMNDDELSASIDSPEGLYA